MGMILTRSWNKLYELAKENKILKKLGDLIRKRQNAVYTSHQIMCSLFKGFLQQLRVYHFPLRGIDEHISTDYRDLERCNDESCTQAKNIIEDFYLNTRKKKKVKITIDGTFIGVRGKTYEKATKMYSGNKKDKGKKGYTIVTCFDTTNKQPMSINCPLIHELHPAQEFIKKAIDWEKLGSITIELFVFDALYFNKGLLEQVSYHKYIIRAPAYKWLLEYVDKTTSKGSKYITLWGHEVCLHWKKNKDEEYILLITNSDYKKVWRVYGHNKQTVENYHDDLKNKFGIKKLPSRKYYAIFVYFCLIILIYMLVRALLLGLSMNKLSCGFLLFVVSKSPSWKNVILNLSKMGRKLSKKAKSLLDQGRISQSLL